MYYLMICQNRAGADAARDELRPSHRQWVASGGNGLARVLIGSAMLDDGGKGCGHFGILEARSREDALAFAEGDPFATGGVVDDIRLQRLADGFQAQRIDAMTK